MHSFFAELTYSATLTLIGLALLALLLLRGKNHPIKICITATDVAGAALALWVAAVVVKNRGAIDPFFPVTCGAVAMCYVFARALHRRWMLGCAIVAVSTVEAAIAIAQRMGWVASRNMFFDVSGTFANPGPLGGLLAVGIVLSTQMARMRWIYTDFFTRNNIRARLLTLCYLCAIPLQAAALLLSGSRAALLGAMAGVALPFFAARFSFSIRRAALCGVAMAATLLALYACRPASANGRLLVWRVCADMVADAPLMGHGVGAFAHEYMRYQASYFAHHPASPLAVYADNVAYPFNEFAGAAVALGLVGVLLLLAVCFFALRAGPMPVRAALVALLAFSCFSYPSDVPELMLLFPILLGCSGGAQVAQVDMQKLRYLCAIAAIAVMAGVGAYSFAQAKRISAALTSWRAQPKTSADRAAAGFVEHIAPRMLRNTTFNEAYFAQLNARPDLLVANSHVPHILPSCEGYILLGKWHDARREPTFAAEAFRTATQMLPHRLRPQYALWEHYTSQGDTAAAADAARRILATPVKVESVYTMRVRAQMRGCVK